MAEFYKGTLDTLIERLCNSISSFDQEWIKYCVPATEGQIRQLQNILAEYHYTIPAAYLYYLRRMGQNDGGLLQQEELGGYESDIDRILELLSDRDFYAREYLEEGFFLFSYHWADSCLYMKLSSMNDNPVVTQRGRDYNIAESFEKYLFWKAFHMYQESFAHSAFYSSSVCREKKEKENCKMCVFCGNTVKERMDFIMRMADTYDLKNAWFSDRTHFFCYCSNYAFEMITEFRRFPK